MNEMPPQQPPYTPPPGGQPPQPPYQAPDPEDPTKKLKIWLGVVCVAALGLIVGAYLFGVKTGEDKYKPGEPGYQEIYADGQAAGATAGAKAGKAKGEAEGQAEGQAEGKEQGKKQGISEGQEEGVQQGASAALGGLTGWSTEAPYVVEFSEGPNSSVPVVISARWLMQPGINYRICSDGSGVCQVAQSSGGDSGGGGDGGGGSGSTGSTP